MSRFKEGRRIDAALEHRDRKELTWAEWYCQSRISTATRKDHLKHWRKILDKVQAALEDMKVPSNNALHRTGLASLGLPSFAALTRRR